MYLVSITYFKMENVIDARILFLFKLCLLSNFINEKRYLRNSSLN